MVDIFVSKSTKLCIVFEILVTIIISYILLNSVSIGRISILVLCGLAVLVCFVRVNLHLLRDISSKCKQHESDKIKIHLF